MKNYYKISEISKLYNIGVDSLRYYEKLGILTPKRDSNGYRLYNLTDMYKLNILRDLRALDFSMAQIKEYLEHLSIDNTLDFLTREQSLLNERIKELKERETIIQERISSLQISRQLVCGDITIKTLPRRLCVQLNEYITRDEEMDFLIKKLHQKHDDKVRDLGNQTICAFVSMEDLMKGRSNVYTSVFFILDQETEDYDFVLPAGDYLSLCYRGDYEQNASQIQHLLNHANENGLTVSGAPFETYLIDNRDTICADEFMTEIQLLLEPE
ncbi:MerR family transcriptional regulator [Faecalicatena contorta]|uniref:MerR family transcriptional regulator n=1 Tax=Faecalicatena contorta TaxID=39482 RepID=UPI001F35F469|nr:MerR family transcriptional regulator [Faecalicatena contorta]MCF2555596.1 MerR family transcriptional regulator [Faecalicatena contorta]